MKKWSINKNVNKMFDKRTLRKIKKNVKGITLIALVVTIIILLILAGVALSLTVGNNGLFRRAENAADTWQMAEQNEQSEMDKVADMLGWYSENTATNVADAIKQNSPYKTDTTITDDLDNEVRIPAGFKIAQDSATTVEGGIVIEDKDGNQFVWIPAKTGAGATINLTSGGTATIIYQRTAYGVNVATGEIDEETNSEKIKHEEGSGYYFTEAMPTNEIESVNANGGYYIGRFEAGDGSSTDFRSSETDGTVVIKKNQVPYSHISQANAKTKSEEMAEVYNYGEAFTKLVSSYAWDTAIDFIQKANSNNEYRDYATSSPEGNYNNTEYGDGLIRTGQTTAVSNIFDMGGNLYEYTTERNSSGATSYSGRGGNYNNSYGTDPAGHRYYGLSGDAGVGVGFRVVLYCSTKSQIL